MPPNISSGSILDQVENRHKQVANPYSEAKNACFEDCPGTSGSSIAKENEDETQEQLTEDTIRVTTRAKLTYGLYKYSKNAMLIVTSENAYKDIIYDSDVNNLKTTFERFRFEVDVVKIGINNAELYETCEQFFQRDFTDYGSVSLVILTPMSVNDPSPGFEHMSFDQSVIMDHFRVERNPTLADKPKIFITEAGRGLFTPLYEHLTAMDRSTYGDVIGFHYYSGLLISIARQDPPAAADNMLELPGYIPLRIFCKKLAAMGDNVNLSEIITQTITDSKIKLLILNPFLRSLETPFGVINTLSKNLYFARVEEN